MSMVVKIEPLRVNTKTVPQCKRCQELNHTQAYCRKEPRCVKCAAPRLGLFLVLSLLCISCKLKQTPIEINSPRSDRLFYVTQVESWRKKLTMEETFMLILLVTVMLVGSYLAGSIPLVMKLSEEKLKIVTVLGAGLLVGTALTVIIPEGIRSLYSSDASSDDKMHLRQFVSTSEDTNNPSVVAPVSTFHEDAMDHSSTIGLSLVLGFVFMMLIDQISQRKSAANDKNITATLGLVVHAAADGVALGAAATTSHQDVEMIVFFAIMLHKAPAAFGLVSFLLHEKIERQQIRKHLAIFSLSAPLLTILTYFGIGQEQKETLNSVNATGIAMLFSAGTFLYVATVHVLPELTQGGHSHGGFENSPGVAYTSLEDNTNNTNATVKRPKGLRNSELIIMIFGALLPLVITFDHHHC